jgi:hypothetical protein
MFNKLWCQALNERTQRGLTHFAMHHSDIQAEPGWLDILLEEQRKVGADVLSAVIPIKDQRGLTSTGLRDPVTGRIRRLTMREVMKLPVTFEAADTDAGDQWLMVNTGLWVCDFTKPWVEEVCFSILDAVVREEDRFVPKALSEDWNFSGWCARQAWGEWDVDRGDG